MSCSHGAGRRMSRVAASMNITVEECDKAMDGIVCERWHPYTGCGWICHNQGRSSYGCCLQDTGVVSENAR
ncbi:MAG: RtcB family protein [Kiritimatiellae bacterium]|nr:RtcB family protein [Kiritimatiellia bacterium]